MDHHQAFLKHLQSRPDAADLLRVGLACKTSNDKDYAFDLNGRLKSGVKLDGNYRADIGHLKNLICARSNSAIRLYRMTSMPQFIEACVEAKGDEFTYSAFMSTSWFPESLRSFATEAAPLFLEIDLPAGMAFAPMEMFHTPNEHQYLLGCGTRFKSVGQMEELDSGQAQELVPGFPQDSLTFLRLDAVKSPSYAVKMEKVLVMLRDETVKLTFQSISTFESPLGRRVVTFWDAALLQFCKELGIRFWANSLAELELLPDSIES